MIFELARGRYLEMKNKRLFKECLCPGTIGPWKFDVLKTVIFGLRTSNFRGATISR